MIFIWKKAFLREKDRNQNMLGGGEISSEPVIE